jgi:aryl-alcohol dehydrogenase-like predicted oxidoreductase
MEMRPLGSSGRKVSVVGLGCNNFGIRCDDASSRAVIKAALDNGIVHFDTAHNYGYGESEKILGDALQSVRDEVFIATKFGGEAEKDPAFQGATRQTIMNSCEDSLRRLKTDRIDLYYLHLPDPATPIEVTLAALTDLVAQGKVRAVGCSHLSGADIADAHDKATQQQLAPFVASQSEWNLLHREIEHDVVPECRRCGLAIVPYFPLASGMLTGKYHAGQPFPVGTRLAGSEYFQREATQLAFQTVERLDQFLQDSGHTLVELALSWLAAQPEVASVIVGATSPAQVAMNVKAMHWKLGAADLQAVDKVLAQVASTSSGSTDASGTSESGSVSDRPIRR